MNSNSATSCGRHDNHELRQSVWGRFLLTSCRMSGLRGRALAAAFRLEGGHFFSSTARQIMRQHYGVEIGAYSYGACFHLGAFQQNVTIGRYVSIGPGVQAHRRNHPIDRLSTHPFFYNAELGFAATDSIPFQTLVISHDCWIGARAIITPGCTRIGLGCVVGAGAVLTRDVPDFSVVGGVPARFIRKRFSDETCELIKASQWWNLSIDQCAAHLEAMLLPLDANPLVHPLLTRQSPHQVDPCVK